MDLDESWDLLKRLVHRTIRALEKKEIAHAEAFFTSTQTTEVSIRNSEILTQNRIDDSGVGFRVVVPRNKVGFACTNTLGEKAIQEAGEKAFTIARVSSEVPNFSLPEASQPPKVKGLFDPRVAEVTVEEAVEIARRAITSAEGFDKRVIAKDGRVFSESGWRGIVNTVGVDCEEQETQAVIYLGGSGKQNGEVTGSCYDYMFSRTADLKPETIGEHVAKMVIDLFKPKPLKSFEGTVIFGPEAVSYQPVSVLVDALKGENVVAQRSTWTGKLEELVTSEGLTITDNAILEEGFASRSFDDEGCASQNTVLIRKGKLKSYLHDATSANTLNNPNTGNASRSPSGFDMVRAIIGNGYRAKPEISPSNLIIQPQDKTKEELVSETERGILVESMAGFPQAGSGMISAQLSRAFLIQNGETTHPIKGGMVSGVAFDWFKHISGIGKDSKRFSNSIVPSLRVEEVKIIGA
ncbi:MAG: TldD/PmbA family protein [Candidatus Bathyarchaeota archaeon]|jgi:predicted Zn-dependent protease|nr:TldD/PmbA family protein [Candidatus Bathyarchaeota archaeon]